jgi:hypothetical protein
LVTHPETAWLVTAVPVLLAVALVLLLSVLARGPILGVLTRMLATQAAKRQQGIDANLVWHPPVVTPERLLAITTLVALMMVAALTRIAPIFVALVLVGPLTLGLIWLLLAVFERRYVAELDRALPAAVSSLATNCASASSFGKAFDMVIGEMDPGPLRAEWEGMRHKFGATLAGGGLALPVQVVEAMIQQTPSERHRTLLGHLAVALTSPHDVLTQRMKAASRSLYRSAQRRSSAVTELAMMRSSGMVVGGAGVFMAGYLALVQWQRFTLAYSTMLGWIVGGVVLGALLLPLVGGFLLARTDDVDY